MTALNFVMPFRPAFDSNGGTIPGAQAYFTLTGTNTPAPVYTSAAMTTLHSNPVVANGVGRFPTTFTNSAITYRVRIYEADAEVGVDIPLEEFDPYTGREVVDGMGEQGPPGDGISTLSSLMGVNPIDGDAAILTVEGREGTFTFRDGDYSAQVAADPEQGVYIAPSSDTTGESGAWVRNSSVEGPFAFRSLGTNAPVTGIFHGVGGNSLSFLTHIANPPGGADQDNHRASVLISADTSDDGNSEEETLCLLTRIATGANTPWAASTAYALGANVKINTNVYRCVTAGTSAGTGSGPTGKGASIVDGTVVWRWINDALIGNKISFYNETVVDSGAGPSWGQAHNIHVNSGVTAKTVMNTEIDLTNNCGVDSVIGGLDKYALAIYCLGANTSTAALEIASPNTVKEALLWGIKLDGDKLAKFAQIQIDSSGTNGIGFGVLAGGVANPTFSDSVIHDSSTALRALNLQGSYTDTAVVIGGSTPAAIGISGAKTYASIYDTSAAPFGLRLEGSYSISPVKTALLPNHADDAAAATGGLVVGAWYRTGSIIKQRIS